MGFVQVIIPAAEKLHGKKVLFVDNCSPHLNVDVLQLCVEKNIMLIPLPPNTTPFTQPCDVCVFRPLKIHWRKTVDEFCAEEKLKGNRLPESLPKKKMGELMMKTMKKFETFDVVARSSFFATGIVPLNRENCYRSESSRNLKLCAQVMCLFKPSSFIPGIPGIMDVTPTTASGQVNNALPLGSDVSSDLIESFVGFFRQERGLNTNGEPVPRRITGIGEAGVPLTPEIHEFVSYWSFLWFG